ncbi:hypothetical protein BASA81_004431 [Batrachochytrium salamandrivorans]|nr:hypothetical protein BASA81_004431 [Batrachochytrium salamandrivorans]
METNEVIAQFPPPPAFYKRFKSAVAGEVPAPPAVPESGQYLLFGETRNLEEKTQTLESEGLRTLFSTQDGASSKEELGKLVLGSKLRFKELLLKLSVGAEQEELDDSLKEFHLQLVNMMYLVNEMREVEARSEVTQLLERQVRFKQDLAAKLRESIERTRTNIAAALGEMASGQRDDDDNAVMECRVLPLPPPLSLDEEIEKLL